MPPILRYSVARPLRLEFAGARYPVTSRGDRREDFYLDDADRTAWLDVVGNTRRFWSRRDTYLLELTR
jgi:hypothetical protein